MRKLNLLMFLLFLFSTSTIAMDDDVIFDDLEDMEIDRAPYEPTAIILRADNKENVLKRKASEGFYDAVQLPLKRIAMDKQKINGENLKKRPFDFFAQEQGPAVKKFKKLFLSDDEAAEKLAIYLEAFFDIENTDVDDLIEKINFDRDYLVKLEGGFELPFVLCLLPRMVSHLRDFKKIVMPKRDWFDVLEAEFFNRARTPSWAMDKKFYVGGNNKWERLLSLKFEIIGQVIGVCLDKHRVKDLFLDVETYALSKEMYGQPDQLSKKEIRLIKTFIKLKSKNMTSAQGFNFAADHYFMVGDERKENVVPSLIPPKPLLKTEPKVLPKKPLQRLGGRVDMLRGLR